MQYVVRWDNWIGNSSVTSGQSQQAMRWDLSEVRDIFDNTLTYEYEQVSRPVGAGGEEHTEASYLSKITNPQGQTVTLVYEEKAANEYQEPHTEQAEPDAYQERYERQAIDKLEVRDESGTLRYTLVMGYETIGSGNFTKRLLTSVQKTGQDGSELPPLQFDYERSGNTTGVLKSVTTSQGGEISYTRTSVTVGNSRRDLVISPGTTTGYAAPQTWIGPDYVVVAWRERDSGSAPHNPAPRRVRLFIYQWVGRWVEHSVGTLSGVSLENGRYADFEVIPGEDFVAIKHDASLYLSHKITDGVGSWSSQRITFAKDGLPSYLRAGEDFVLVGGQFLDNGELSAWRWNGSDWDKETFNLPEGDYAYTAANNYFIAHNNDPNPDRISIHYTDKEGIWRSKTASSFNSFTSGKGGGVITRSFWQGANSFAAVVADENDGDDDSQGYVYQWNEEYTLTLKDRFGQWRGKFQPVVTNNNLIGLSNRGGSSQAFRFNGNSWIETLRNGVQAKHSYGENFYLFSYPTPELGGFIRQYNPNQSSWSETNLPGERWFSAKAGIDFVFFDDDVYYRNTNGVWNRVYTLPSLVDLETSDHLQTGSTLVAVYSPEARETYVIQVKNGDASVIATLSGKSISQEGEAVKATPLVGSDIVITFGALSDGSGQMQNMTRLTLHKVIDGQLTGPQQAYPVQSVTVESGLSTQYVSYDYTAASATMSASGGVAQFNQVRTVPGVSNPATRPYGYTTQFFFNGLRTFESDRSFPTAINGSNPSRYYGKLLGIPYISETYNRNGGLVAASKSYWRVYERDLKRSTGVALTAAYYAQVIRQETSSDGVQQVADYDYGDDETTVGVNSVFRHGQLRSMTTTDSEGRTRRAQYQYAKDDAVFSQYNSGLLRDAHIINQPLTQAVTVSGTTVQRSETYYQAQSNPAASPVPERTVAYPRGNGSSITVNYLYDNYGNLVESNRTGGLTTATLWGYDYTRPVAQSVGVSYGTLSGQVSPGSVQNLSDAALQQALGPLRSLTDARVSTYSYDRLYGVTVETDPNGRKMIYHYDDLNRLQWIESQEGHVVQKYDYQYAQP